MPTEPSASSTVDARVHQMMDGLSDAERRVARRLLADYPACGLGTSHSLAAEAGVSAPTVVRLATRLGFTGFSDMQRALRSEVSSGASSPVQRTIAQSHDPHGPTPFAEAMQRRAEAVTATARRLPPSELDSAIGLITGCTKQILITGGFFSRSIAQVLALQLSQVRGDVVYVDDPLRHDAGLILDARRRSVLVLFDLRRYEPASLELAQQVKASGLDVILITDRWMSPVAAVADVVLTAEVEAVPFDTFVGLLALVETIVESVMSRMGAQGIRRMRKWEAQAVGHTRAHNTNPPHQ
ncbi:MurR/RpiR family transcriptional regulator [Allobranchiibius sp. GilTou73]|uniref:MurR/RpiR family transcriptional regulator n=1 Tax=Allobranchiibius sp. GilTou73 TaxID=2904523 RepID=UPI001F3AD1C8|nr:MurR/RpiR family transcriptional regulator [Allobranchiibius sp. GilTou73]UIJ33763.1 MurR/RpiR family transcriptional regulator [Allobranchiibius sp. GilTou73]